MSEDELTHNQRNAWHVLKYQLMNEEGDTGGEIIDTADDPLLGEADAKFTIGDHVVFRFPQRLRDWHPVLKEFRGLGRVLRILPARGEPHYEIQAIEEGLDTAFPVLFTMRESDLSSVSGEPRDGQ